MKEIKVKVCSSNTKQWIVGIIANITILTSGMQTGWMSPNILILQSDESPSGYPLSDYQISIMASCSPLVAAIFCGLYSIITDKYGRKIGLIAVAVPQAISWIIRLVSANFIALVISQSIAGIAGGGVFSVTPVYTKEISRDSIRGSMGSIGMLLSSVGALLMYVLGGYLQYYTSLWIVVWIPIFNLLCLLKAPESPVYLLKNGQNEKATAIIAYLFSVEKNDDIVTSVVAGLKKELEEVNNLPSVSVKHILSNKASRKGLFIAITLITILDIGGNFAIITYASLIVQESGVTINPNVQAMAFPLVRIFGALLSLAIVEKIGRKPLLLTSIFFTLLPMGVLATYLVLKENGTLLPIWLPLVSIIVCVFAYGAGILPVPYIVMSEIFSFQIRIKILGFINSLGWFFCFLQVVTFTPVSRCLGMYTMFYVFCGINLVGGVIISILLPETKGKSLEEIETKFRGN